MGTKNNPGKYDCYANAAPDEPMFVLLGRDPCAPILVQLWALIREEMGEDVAVVREAIDCAAMMEVWALALGKSGKIKAALAGLRSGLRKADIFMSKEPA
jgi:hypothetical protein